MSFEEIDDLLKATANQMFSKPELSFQKNEELIDLCIAQGYHDGHGIALNTKGNYYFYRDETEEAIGYYIQADRILEKSAIWDTRIIAKITLATVYNKIGQYQTSIQLYKNIEKEISDKPVDFRHLQVYLNMDHSYLTLGDKDLALEYALKAYNISKGNDEFKFIYARSLSHLAGIYTEMGDLDLAQSYLNECLESDINIGHHQLIAKDLSRASKISYLKKEYQKSIDYSQQSLDKLSLHPNAEIKIEVLKQLADSHKSKGDLAQSIEYLEQYIAENNAFLSAQKTNIVAGLNRKYDLEKKEVQLKEMKLNQLDAEIKAIKSQMDPHFVFNVMSTIDGLIEIGQIDTARESMRSFSQLMRMTLEYSQVDFITIEDEVNLLKHYIQLEKMAIGDSLEYSIDIDVHIDATFDRVPAKLIQPIVENALKHGLKHLEGKKILQIKFSLNQDHLTVTIQDNGIGRENSKAINQSRKNHNSYASNAIENRLKYLNQREETDRYQVKIEDLSQGTQVLLSL